MKKILSMLLAFNLAVFMTTGIQADDMEEACQVFGELADALDEMATGVHNDELSPEDVEEGVASLKEMAAAIKDPTLTSKVNAISNKLNKRDQDGFVDAVDDLVDYIDAELEENCE